MEIKVIKLSMLGLFFMLFLCVFSFSFSGKIQTSGFFYSEKDGLFETRSCFLLEGKKEIKDWLIFSPSMRINGVFSNKEEAENKIFPCPNDIRLNFYFPAMDIKIGYSKVFWGKLDQISPVDIVNPLDITRLFLEGEKKEAKLAVSLLEISPYWGESRFDFILVPFFRKGTYDELKKKNSPFEPVCFPLPLEENLPSENIENMEYGGRFSSTLKEIDWSLYYFRGFGDFPSYCLDINLNKIDADYFKNDMFGCDFELVKGKWGIRGEGALLTNIGFQSKNSLNYTRGDSFTGGLGADRTFGNNYLNLNLLYKKVFVDTDVEEEKDEVTVTANIEKKFSYETKRIEIFSMYNIVVNSLFVKGTFSVSWWENFWTDLTAGIFEGEGRDNLSKFRSNDFFSIKFEYSF